MAKTHVIVKEVSNTRSTCARQAFPQPARLTLFMCVLAVLAGCSQTTDVFEGLNVGDKPRLQNGEPERRGPIINAAAFNAEAMGRTIAPYSGFIGSQHVSYEGDRETIKSDLDDLGKVAPRNFNPNAMVTIDFKDASLSFILEQLLRGALGVNYVAPRELPDQIDFRMETPIPKSRVIQVVRDLLSRYNLVTRLINGVYHIGSPSVIEALSENSAAGRAGEENVKVIQVGKGKAPEVAALAGQLISQDKKVSIIAADASSIVLKADPNDIQSIEQMILTLSKTALGSNKVAIIPLTRSAPEAVAAQLNQFYSKSLREETSSATILPLTNQQAILVGTSDAELMRGIQQLAAQLDRSVTDISELRIIPLTSLRAADIAPQLAQIFGSTTSAQEPEPSQPPERAQPRTGVGARLNTPPALTPQDDEEGTGLSVPSPPPANTATSRSAPARQADQQGNDPFLASVTAAPQAGETRIVADPRTNSILVYSTYAVFKRMREVVQTLDVPQSQVIIEATVLEVELNDALESGVQFFLQSNGIVVGSGIPSGNQSPNDGGIVGIGANLGNVSVDAVMRALRSITNLKVVSSPYLTVVNGESARLVIGDQIPFATSTQTSSNQGNVTVTQDVKILDTGVVLEITPRIHANNSVQLDIAQSVSTPSSQSAADTLTPVIATRDISSRILAQSGRTILLGGMIQDRIERSEKGTPGASDLPLFGKLFKQNVNKARRTELLVLITPRVVRTSSEIEAITRLLQSAAGVNYEDVKSR